MKIPTGEVSRMVRVLTSTNGVPVRLVWSETTGGTRDPVTGALTGATTVPRTATVKALVYFAEAKGVQRNFVEVAAGDAIVDFPADVDLDNKPGLRFVIADLEYVPKETSDRLTSAWDVALGTERITRTLLLKRAT